VPELRLFRPTESTNMPPTELTAKIKDAAHALGFELAGVCPAVTPTGISRFAEWLDRGFDGEMAYFRRRQKAYSHPEHVLAAARSLVMLAMPYRTVPPRTCRSGEGRVSRYAWNEQDYHDVIRQRLDALIVQWQVWTPEARLRGVVDTAPLLERDFAQLAGLGWVGKNTLLLNKVQGSWFFLAAVLTDQELQYDARHEADHCGTCRACLDACPTQAFPQPYVLDARRCISYLTIELRGPIPADLRIGMGEWVFGCDICQDVCPWNHKAPAGDEQLYGPAVEMNPLSLAGLFHLDDDAFRRRFKQTALWRPRRRGLLRNAAIVLGNQRDEAAVEALARGLADVDSIVRGACAWALGQIQGESAKTLLVQAAVAEADPQVRDEIQLALSAVESSRVP
jgi:epoxyqueuosine reductase